MAKATQTKASKSKKPLKETHGALPPKPATMNMMKAFGIRDGYDTDDRGEYLRQLEGMTDTDLQDHAHTVGVVPLSPRDKLVTALERKFIETKNAQRPPRTLRFPTLADKDPKWADMMKRWQQGEYNG